MPMSPLWWLLCHPRLRVTVAESLIHDLGSVSEWCDLCGMKLNVNKTKTMIVSWSRTMRPQSPPLTIGRTVLKETVNLVILGMTFDSKMASEKHLCSVSRAASQRLDILKSWRVFNDRSLLGNAFISFGSPAHFVRFGVLFCSVVLGCWHTHLKLLDRAVSGAQFLTGGVFDCNIVHRSVAVLCMLYKMRCDLMHPLDPLSPKVFILRFL